MVNCFSLYLEGSVFYLCRVYIFEFYLDLHHALERRIKHAMCHVKEFLSNLKNKHIFLILNPPPPG